jgi:hypothetical protein
MSKSCPPVPIFEEKAMAFLGGMTFVSTSVHVIVGTGGDGVEVLARGEAVGTSTGVEVGEDGADRRTLAGEAVGPATGVKVGEEIVEWTEGDAVPPATNGVVLGVGLAAQATSTTITTASTKVRPTNRLLMPKLVVDSFHMGMFPPVFQPEVP